MYANLRVQYMLQDGTAEEVFAHEVTIDGDGVIYIGVDGQDGSGSYAEPVGERTLRVEDLSTLRVRADF